MKKTINISILSTLLFATSLLMNSCSSEQSPKGRDIKSSQTKVSGFLSDVFEVVDGTHTFDYDTTSYPHIATVEVSIKAIGVFDPASAFDSYIFDDGLGGPLFLELLDGNGNAISGMPKIPNLFSTDRKLYDMMGRIGEPNTITFKAKVYDKSIIPDNVVSFAITSIKLEDQNNAEITEDFIDEKWNKALDDYDLAVTNYIDLLTKAHEGDSKAESDVPFAKKKAEKLEEELSHAKSAGELSYSQIIKRNNIDIKLMDADDLEN